MTVKEFINMNTQGYDDDVDVRVNDISGLQFSRESMKFVSEDFLNLKVDSWHIDKNSSKLYINCINPQEHK